MEFLWPDRFAMGDEGKIALVSYAAAYGLKETEYAETCICYISLELLDAIFNGVD